MQVNHQWNPKNRRLCIWISGINKSSICSVVTTSIHAVFLKRCSIFLRKSREWSDTKGYCGSLQSMVSLPTADQHLEPIEILFHHLLPILTLLEVHFQQYDAIFQTYLYFLRIHRHSNPITVDLFTYMWIFRKPLEDRVFTQNRSWVTINSSAAYLRESRSLWMYEQPFVYSHLFLSDAISTMESSISQYDGLRTAEQSFSDNHNTRFVVSTSGRRSVTLKNWQRKENQWTKRQNYSLIACLY